jgi:hypothetical protein
MGGYIQVVMPKHFLDHIERAAIIKRGEMHAASRFQAAV